MSGDEERRPDRASGPRRLAVAPRPRRPWMLVVSALLFALLSAILWTKWQESRTRAAQLEEELRQVYAETEALRTQAARAQRRIEQLEHDLRAVIATRERGAARPVRGAR